MFPIRTSGQRPPPPPSPLSSPLGRHEGETGEAAIWKLQMDSPVPTSLAEDGRRGKGSYTPYGSSRLGAQRSFLVRGAAGASNSYHNLSLLGGADKASDQESEVKAKKTKFYRNMFVILAAVAVLAAALAVTLNFSLGFSGKTPSSAFGAAGASPTNPTDEEPVFDTPTSAAGPTNSGGGAAAPAPAPTVSPTTPKNPTTPKPTVRPTTSPQAEPTTRKGNTTTATPVAPITTVVPTTSKRVIIEPSTRPQSPKPGPTNSTVGGKVPITTSSPVVIITPSSRPSIVPVTTIPSSGGDGKVTPLPTTTKPSSTPTVIPVSGGVKVKVPVPLPTTPSSPPILF